jgi:hypothetical protein
MLGQLGTQRRLDNPPREPRQQAPRTSDLLGPKPLKRVLQRVLGQQPRKPVDNLLTGTLGHHGARRLSPSRSHLLD